MVTPRVFVEAFLLLVLGITGLRLLDDRGGGQYFFTLLLLVIVGTVLPYVLTLWALPRVPPRWGTSLGVGASIVGTIDAAVRTQAFYFPTEASGGGMAFWLPLYAIVAIPLVTCVIHLGRMAGLTSRATPPSA